MVRTMNIWTDDTPEAEEARRIRYLRSGIKTAEKGGATFSKQSYIAAGLPVPDNATDKFQQPPLWRRIINSLRPVW